MRVYVFPFWDDVFLFFYLVTRASLRENLVDQYFRRHIERRHVNREEFRE